MKKQLFGVLTLSFILSHNSIAQISAMDLSCATKRANLYLDINKKTIKTVSGTAALVSASTTAVFAELYRSNYFNIEAQKKALDEATHLYNWNKIHLKEATEGYNERLAKKTAFKPSGREQWAEFSRLLDSIERSERAVESAKTGVKNSNIRALKAELAKLMTERRVFLNALKISGGVTVLTTVPLLLTSASDGPLYEQFNSNPDLFLTYLADPSKDAEICNAYRFTPEKMELAEKKLLVHIEQKVKSQEEAKMKFANISENSKKIVSNAALIPAIAPDATGTAKPLFIVR